jgi:hypothetical protein
VPDAAGINYEQEVRPILANRCFGCHGPRQQQSGLRLDLRQNALRGGDYGVVIVPGRSADSKLIQRLIGSDAGLQMPPTGELPAEEIAVLKKWIDAGADMPGRAAEAAAAERPTEPRVQNFFDTIAGHDLAAVRRMLAKDRSLARAADSAGSTALMQSAYAGTLEIMEALLEAGADVKARNRRGATALHWAISDPMKAKLLLLHGADVDARTVDGRTALHAATMQPSGARVVKLLDFGLAVYTLANLTTAPLEDLPKIELAGLAGLSGAISSAATAGDGHGRCGKGAKQRGTDHSAP